MAWGAIRSHLTDAFALEGEAPPPRRAMLVAALGMGVPVLAGVALGRLEVGLTIGLGAILLASGAAPAAAEPERHPARAALPALAAVAAASLIGARAWTDQALIALVATAALLTGYSRPLAVAAIRFSVYLVLSVGVVDGAAGHRGAAALVFGLGAVWNIVLRLLLTRPVPAPASEPARAPTPAQRRAHFRRTLRTAAGWQFPARLAGALAVASVIRHARPDHHFYWIMLTVALLTQRPVERLPVKTTQRLVGVAAGAAVAWTLLALLHARPALAVAACVLAALTAVARARSYLLYSILTTPLILLVLDLGRPIDTGLLVDRLVATLIGGGLVIAGNLLAELVIDPEATKPRAAARPR